MKDSQGKSPAGFWPRAKAFALDYVIILLYLGTIALFALVFNSPFWTNHRFLIISHWLFADRVRAQLSGFLLLTLPVSLYFALSESSSQQGTWGKRKAGLIVTDSQGMRISLWRSLVRTALKFVPWELSHTLIWNITFFPYSKSTLVMYGFVVVYVLVGLNLAGLILSKNHQTLYDLLAGTFVVKQVV